MDNNRYLKSIINQYNIAMKEKNATQTDDINQKIYLDKLIEQYKTTTGTQNIDLNSASFIIDLNNWIAINKLLGENYLTLLEPLGIFYDKKNCAEIGKGYRDSLVLPFETTIITPYTKGIDKRPKISKTIDSKFKVEYGVPMIYEKDEIVPETIIKPTEIDTFMTQNPYSGTNIYSWCNIHNNNNYNGIILGVFGKTYDKDREEKIKQLNNLKALLHDNYIEESLTIRDSYYYILATDTLEKRKKLTKTKTGNK